MFNNFNLSDEEILHIIDKYKPLIDSKSYINGKFDEDLNQEIILFIYRIFIKNRKK